MTTWIMDVDLVKREPLCPSRSLESLPKPTFFSLSVFSPASLSVTVVKGIDKLIDKIFVVRHWHAEQ